MRELPIFFNSEMVRAILDGRKTQTRRPIRPQPERYVNYKETEMWFYPGRSARWWAKHRKNYLHDDGIHWKTTPVGSSRWVDPEEREWASKHIKPPYQVGDMLYVREKFQPLLADGCDFSECEWETGKGYEINYVADGTILEWIDGEGNMGHGCKPSIHMPKWAARIWLKVKSVRVERIQDISEEDAKAEGIEFKNGMYRDFLKPYIMGFCWSSTIVPFRDLWDSIYKNWDDNPFVWVFGFERIEK